MNAIATGGLLAVLIVMRGTVAAAAGEPAGAQDPGGAEPAVAWTSSDTRTAAASQSLIVRFADGVTARRTEAGLLLSGVEGEALRKLRELLAGLQIVDIQPLFERPPEDLAAERKSAEQRTGEAQPDLNLFFRLILGVDEEAASVLTALTGLEAVETTYLAPASAPDPSPAPGGRPE